MPSKPGDSSDLGRLRWQCRRGMLELDLLLEGFLERRFPHLPPTQQQAFVRLLETPDPQLYDWLMGRGVPADPDLQGVLGLLRERA